MDKNQKKVTELFALYEKKLYTIAFSILHDSYLAEDAVLDAFLKLIQAQYSIDSIESDQTKNLLIQMIRSSAIDIYRRQQRFRSFTVSAEENQEFVDSLALPPSSSRIDMEAMISELPERYREVIRHRFIYDHSYSQVAQILGITEATVRKRQERAIKILRRKVGNYL